MQPVLKFLSIKSTTVSKYWTNQPASQPTNQPPILRPLYRSGLSMEESTRMTEDRDKWRKYVHGVANPRIEDG